MLLPFTKPCDLQGDAQRLARAYAVVDSVPDALANQHDIRRWEYAMAVYTINAWDTATGPLGVADIGGASSNFWKVLRATGMPAQPILLIDPLAPERVWRDGDDVQYWKEGIETFAGRCAHDQFDVITAISVIEHVKNLRPFFRACRMLLKPGGLLFLTTDFWDAEGEDTAHFHWMRERIYNVDRMKRLLMDLRELGFRSFGQADWAYPGNQLYDYSVCSAAMVKK